MPMRCEPCCPVRIEVYNINGRDMNDLIDVFVVVGDTGFWCSKREVRTVSRPRCRSVYFVLHITRVLAGAPFFMKYSAFGPHHIQQYPKLSGVPGHMRMMCPILRPEAI